MWFALRDRLLLLPIMDARPTTTLQVAVSKSLGVCCLLRQADPDPAGAYLLPGRMWLLGCRPRPPLLQQGPRGRPVAQNR